MATPHKCPVCDGAGKLLRPPWVAGDQPGWVSTDCAPHTCEACGGMRVLWSEDTKPDKLELARDLARAARIVVDNKYAPTAALRDALARFEAGDGD